MSKGGYQTKISKEEIEQLPVKEFTGDIYVIDKKEKINTVKPLLHNIRYLGFDTETRPSFKKGKKNKLALIQLANSDHAFLFRINKIGIPDLLKEIIEDKHIYKIGVALKDDLRAIKKIVPCHPVNFIDLQPFVKNFGIEDNGLKKLTANILKFKISKRQQTSNWEQHQLSESQIVYSATDAWVCYEIYKTLNGASADILD